MTKALQLCRSFHAAGHRVLLVESPKYRLTGHRFSRAVDAFHTVPDPDDAGLHRGAARDRRAARASTSTCRCAARQPASPTPAPRSCSRSAARSCTSTRTCWSGSTTSTSSPALPRRWACGCRRPTGSPTPQQVLDFDFARGRWPYILKSIAYDPVHRLDLTHLPFGPADEMAAFVAVARRSRRRTRGSCRSSSRVRSTAPTARSATAGCRSTAAASPRRPSSTTRWWTTPRSATWVEHVQSGARAHRSGVVRLHRGRRRCRLRDRVQPAHALGDHDALRPRRGGAGVPRRRRRPAGRGSDPGQPTDVLDLPRGLAAAHRPREGVALAHDPARARTRSSTGGTRCRS